ncbi:MAG: S9 family peptidase [Actinomycetota bacterium]|nr:S9 family peptidase [Actinomycetota bacterium]
MVGTTAALDGTVVSVEPGSTATCELRLRNPSDRGIELAIDVRGGVSEWAWAAPPHLTVPAGGEEVARIVFRPPRSPELGPGPVGFEVGVVPTGEPDGEVTVVRGVIEVAPFAEVTAQLDPRVAKGLRSTSHRLTLENTGNVSSGVAIEAVPHDNDRHRLAVDVEPASVPLRPGERATVTVTARAPRPTVGGRVRRRSFGVAVSPNASRPLSLEGTMEQQPVRWLLPVVGLILIALAAVGLARSGSTTRSSTAGRAPDVPASRFAVGRTTETFVDSSRPTEAHGPVAAEPARTLRTLILYPATGAVGAEPVEGAAPATAGGPFPLIVFAHGSGGGITNSLGLLRTWAAAGYVVAAPTFPFAANPADISADDYPNQPADMSFVASEIISLSQSGGGLLRGLVDPERLGAAGHSLGGFTTLGLVGHACCEDARFKAAVVLAGRQEQFPNGDFDHSARTPILFVHGDVDERVRYADGRVAYMHAPAPKFLLTILDGDHGAPYQGPPERADVRVVRASTLDFFDLYLRGDRDALERLHQHAHVAGVATLESQL